MPGKGFLGRLEDLGIIENDTPTDASAQADASTPSTAPVTSPPVTQSAPQTGVADPEMVAKIKAAVTASTHAPRLTAFLANLETAKAAFPNDARSAANAALAFSKLTSADIRDELTKAVAAALIEAESKIKGDVGKQREQLATELDTQAEGYRGTISRLESDIKTLQGQLGTAQTALSQVDVTRAKRTAAITGSETTALASLAAVKAEIDGINDLLP